MSHTVYVIDDNLAYLRAISRYLSSDGWKVMTFSDGAQILDALGDQLPFAIVSDIEMPEMNGAALAELVTDVYSPMLGRIVFSSSTADESLRLAAKRHGPVLDKDDSRAILRFLHSLLGQNLL